ncbi:hypothetical protein FE374_04240 [Georgenia yuyongxinii]|uniref:Uncharacterized protein n=1 Tax=Georgenia yuyongxinii TaxID=2589797 RepID=A0A5B8C1L9_9MICO|nr:hypothetical protein [Georgenia yuyongxinii]QDC23950.1 hypothetical protein FE374_04240 [Georgenia yuyongxinii]
MSTTTPGPAGRDPATGLRAGPLSRRRAATCADAAAGVGTTSGLALGLMFAIEVPTDGPFVFGATNDVLGAAFNLLVIPVYAELGSELPPGRTRDVLLPAAIGAGAVGAASGTLLVARVLPFAPSTALSTAAIAVQAVWMLVSNDRLLRRPDFPRRLGRLGRVIGAAQLLGGAVVGAGLALPRGSLGRRAAFVVGGLPGVAAWALWPAWFYLAARYLDQPAPAEVPAGGDRPGSAGER